MGVSMGKQPVLFALILFMAVVVNNYTVEATATEGETLTERDEGETLTERDRDHENPKKYSSIDLTHPIRPFFWIELPKRGSKGGATAKKRKSSRIKGGIIDPCNRSNPPLGCIYHNSKPREEVNPWKRACSQISRCRGGHG